MLPSLSTSISKSDKPSATWSAWNTLAMVLAAFVHEITVGCRCPSCRNSRLTCKIHWQGCTLNVTHAWQSSLWQVYVCHACVTIVCTEVRASRIHDNRLVLMAKFVIVFHKLKQMWLYLGKLGMIWDPHAIGTMNVFSTSGRKLSTKYHFCHICIIWENLAWYGIHMLLVQWMLLVCQVENYQQSLVIFLWKNLSTNLCHRLRRLVLSYKREISILIYLICTAAIYKILYVC